MWPPLLCVLIVELAILSGKLDFGAPVGELGNREEVGMGVGHEQDSNDDTR
jgi:hypothetical protein